MTEPEMCIAIAIFKALHSEGGYVMFIVLRTTLLLPFIH